MTSQHWRIRVLATVAPAAAALLGVTVLVPTPSGPAPEPEVAGASETECLPTGRLNSIGALNAFADRVRGGPEFQGADIGASTALQDGRSLFVFGDTLRSASFAGQRFVRNSMLVFTPSCAQVVLPHDHGALIPDRADGVGYWPMSVVTAHRTGYDLVAVATQRVRDNGRAQDGVFAFDILGSSMAVFLVPRGGVPQLIAQQDFGSDRVDTTRPIWGAASAVSGGWLYLYGTARPATGATGFSLRVARLRPEDLLDQSRWHYWDGSAWVSSPDAAAVLIPDRDGVSQTLSVFEKNGRWYALSKRGETLGNDLTVWTAPSPTGPFTAGPALADIPSDAVTGELRYMPLAHPDLLPSKNSVVVSYSRNNTDLSSVEADPTRYRPRFLRVTLPR